MTSSTSGSPVSNWILHRNNRFFRQVSFQSHPSGAAKCLPQSPTDNSRGKGEAGDSPRTPGGSARSGGNHTEFSPAPRSLDRGGRHRARKFFTSPAIAVSGDFSYGILERHPEQRIRSHGKMILAMELSKITFAGDTPNSWRKCRAPLEMSINS